MTPTRAHELKCIRNLGRKLLSVGERVIHHKDIEQREIEPLQEGLESGVHLEHMHVDIDRPKGGEPAQRLLCVGRARFCTR